MSLSISKEFLKKKKSVFNLFFYQGNFVKISVFCKIFTNFENLIIWQDHFLITERFLIVHRNKFHRFLIGKCFKDFPKTHFKNLWKNSLFKKSLKFVSKKYKKSPKSIQSFIIKKWSFQIVRYSNCKIFKMRFSKCAIFTKIAHCGENRTFWWKSQIFLCNFHKNVRFSQ